MDGEGAVAAFPLDGAGAGIVCAAVAAADVAMDAIDGFGGNAVVQRVDDAADGVAAIQQGGGPAQDLDAVGR
ncbi:hypothetical protein G6F59_017679 [Rhizopus arrhizus]|nr:hypothetical protein G6F59_017679 [Rhizopus arrhizus]